MTAVPQARPCSVGRIESPSPPVAYAPGSPVCPRPELFGVCPAVHGSADVEELQRLGLDADRVLDFSANVNPYGPAPGVRAALASARIDRYPDPEATLLRRTLSAHLGVVPSQIIAGNGASELIWLAALAFVRPDDKVFVLGPTYGEYARSATLMGGSVITLQATAEHGFTMDVDVVSKALKTYQPRLLFVCNPNNPTGATLAPDVLATWSGRHQQAVFVVDEAYLPFVSELDSAIKLRAKNVLVLRSMTKDFALPGLRLGYAVGAEEMIGWLRRVRPPWSVNAGAQAAGVAAVHNTAYYCRTFSALEQAKAHLVRGLAALGFEVIPARTPFFLVRVGDGFSFRQRLLRRGMLVRDGASFGLPEYVRIATRRPEENEKLLAVLREEASHAG